MEDLRVHFPKQNGPSYKALCGKVYGFRYSQSRGAVTCRECAKSLVMLGRSEHVHDDLLNPKPLF